MNVLTAKYGCVPSRNMLHDHCFQMFSIWALSEGGKRMLHDHCFKCSQSGHSLKEGRMLSCLLPPLLNLLETSSSLLHKEFFTKKGVLVLATLVSDDPTGEGIIRMDADTCSSSVHDNSGALKSGPASLVSASLV